MRGQFVIPRLTSDIYFACIQNLATFAPALPEIMIAGIETENGSCHVTLTTLLLGVVFHG